MNELFPTWQICAMLHTWVCCSWVVASAAAGGTSMFRGSTMSTSSDKSASAPSKTYRRPVRLSQNPTASNAGASQPSQNLQWEAQRDVGGSAFKGAGSDRTSNAAARLLTPCNLPQSLSAIRARHYELEVACSHQPNLGPCPWGWACHREHKIVTYPIQTCMHS